MRRIIREEEPPKPSTRLSTLGAGALPTVSARATDASRRRSSRLVQGDLDWIVMKALEKDRTRRYETASGFAADVRRYLRQEPVEARPPSPLVSLPQVRPRRNKALLTTASLVLAALVLGTGSQHLASDPGHEGPPGSRCLAAGSRRFGREASSRRTCCWTMAGPTPTPAPGRVRLSAVYQGDRASTGPLSRLVGSCGCSSGWGFGSRRPPILPGRGAGGTGQQPGLVGRTPAVSVRRRHDRLPRGLRRARPGPPILGRPFSDVRASRLPGGCRSRGTQYVGSGSRGTQYAGSGTGAAGRGPIGCQPSACGTRFLQHADGAARHQLDGASERPSIIDHGLAATPTQRTGCPAGCPGARGWSLPQGEPEWIMDGAGRSVQGFRERSRRTSRDSPTTAPATWRRRSRAWKNRSLEVRTAEPEACVSRVGNGIPACRPL